MRPRAARNERTGSKHVPGENLTRIEAQERAALELAALDDDADAATTEGDAAAE